MRDDLLLIGEAVLQVRLLDVSPRGVRTRTIFRRCRQKELLAFPGSQRGLRRRRWVTSGPKNQLLGVPMRVIARLCVPVSPPHHPVRGITGRFQFLCLHLLRACDLMTDLGLGSVAQVSNLRVQAWERLSRRMKSCATAAPYPPHAFTLAGKGVQCISHTL